MSLRKLYYQLPSSWRFLARRAYFLPRDLLDKMRGEKSSLPPKGMIYTGGGDFEEAGNKFTSFLKEYTVLQGNSKLLDIGSGIGRLAIPLTQVLNAEGVYEGFDVVEQGVNWCKKHITSEHPNFRFTHVALKNDLYNSQGASAVNYIFDYESDFFSHVVLISIFTHFQKEELEHYLKEIHRVLALRQYCLASFFIYSEKEELNRNRSFRFPHHFNDYALMDERVKAANVAFNWKYLKTLVHNIGFEIEHYLPGTWKGESASSKDFQDILILKKK